MTRPFLTEANQSQRATPSPFLINHHLTVRHLSCLHFYSGDLPPVWGAEGQRPAWGQVSTVTVSLRLFIWAPCFIPMAAERAPPPLFPRGLEARGRECEPERGWERANKFSANTVIQYGCHCVTANRGWSSRHGEEIQSCND